jgi:CO/xanthine dehydrogenase Mo-binding subunit
MATPQPSTFTIIGKPIPRVEGVDKITGAAAYTADVLPEGMVWAKNVRSPLPHARIVSIDTLKARAMPGVLAVITAADIPNDRTGRSIKDVPLLCDDKVRFVGDKVAVVAAESREIAEAAVQLVNVEYEELPAVFDPEEAMQEQAPIIHSGTRSYLGFPEIGTDIPNVCGHDIWEEGDIEQGFKDADLIIEHKFITQLSHQGYLEPSAWLVDASSSSEGRSERVEVWASNKMPYTTRRELGRLFKRPEKDLHLHPIAIGADFGSKSTVGDAPIAYYLSRMLERPVKFVNSAAEDLTAGQPKHAFIIKLRTGVKRDGKIIAHDATVIMNRGAYAGLNSSANGLLGGAQRVGNFYDIPNKRIEAFAAYTNRVPCGYMRAPGSPQALFAIEAHLNLIASELGMDPIEIRKRNVPSKAASGADHLAPEILDQAAKAFGWSDRTRAGSRASRPGKLVGHGVAMADRGHGAGDASSSIKVNPDGTITATTSLPDNGTGGLTVVAAVVAESFGVPLNRVHVVHSGTDEFPIDVEAGGSKTTNSSGTAALAASNQVQEQLKPLASRALGGHSVEWQSARRSEGDPPTQGGWRSGNGRFISLESLAAELVRDSEPLATATVTMRAPRTPDNGICVQMAEVEIDIETGQVFLNRFLTAQDVGTIINELGHQGQINGAVVQGIGYALMEELLVEDGRVITPNFADYKMPTIQDAPQLITVNVPDRGDALGPFHAKSIGEIPTIPTAGAIANAIADAIEAPIAQLPVTAERVFQALSTRDSN